MAKVEVSSSGTTRGRRGAVVEANDGPPDPTLAVVSTARAGRAEVAVVTVGSAGAFA